MKSRNVTFSFLFILITAILLSGCRGSFPNTASIDNQFSGVSFNKIIELIRVQSILEEKTFNRGLEIVSFEDYLLLDLVNNSKNKIKFPPCGGPIYFQYDYEFDEWIRVTDRRTCGNKNPEVLLPKDAPHYLPGFFNITPSIPWTLNSTDLIPFRVVVIGEIITDDGAIIETVGATYDFFYR